MSNRVVMPWPRPVEEHAVYDIEEVLAYPQPSWYIIHDKLKNGTLILNWPPVKWRESSRLGIHIKAKLYFQIKDRKYTNNGPFIKIQISGHYVSIYE